MAPYLGTAPCRYSRNAIAVAVLVAIILLAVGYLGYEALAPFRGRLLVPGLDLSSRLSRYFQLEIWVLRYVLLAVPAMLAGLVAARTIYRRTSRTEPFATVHADDPRLFYDVDAERQLQYELNLVHGRQSKRGIRLSPHLTLPFAAENQFTLVVGDKGSGKSNLIRAFASQFVRRGDRTLLHCVKGDVTRSFKPDEAVLLAPHDADGWAWDIGKDVTDESGLQELAVATIPSSDQPFWSQTARALFVDIAKSMLLDLQGRPWTIEDLVRRMLADPVEIEQRIRTLDLSSSPLLMMGEDGMSSTAFGVMATLWSGVLNTLRPLVFAWRAHPPKRRFSLTAWLSPDYTGPKVVILQTSAIHRELTQLVSRLLLSRIIAKICDSSLSVSSSRRITFVLDEFAALGRVENIESALAIGREKGLVVVAALQSLNQLPHIYGADVGKILLDLFGIRIFLKLSAGQSAEEASRLIGRRTIRYWEHNLAPVANDRRKLVPVTAERPLVSAAVLQGELGVGRQPGRDDVRVSGIVTAGKNAHWITWPMSRWAAVRGKSSPAPWLRSLHRPKPGRAAE